MICIVYDMYRLCTPTTSEWHMPQRVSVADKATSSRLYVVGEGGYCHSGVPADCELQFWTSTNIECCAFRIGYEIILVELSGEITSHQWSI